MNILKLSVLGVSMAATCIATVNAQSVDEIMDKHAQAIGGIENWNKIKTMKMTGSMTQQGMEIGLKETLEMGKALRMDISVMGMNGFQIVTKNKGWVYMPFMGAAKVDTMKADVVQAQQKQLDVKGNQMLDYKSNGSKAEYVGRDTIKGAPCFKVKFTDKDGNESTSFFDCATYYLVRTESKVKQHDEETEVAVIYDKYKKFDEGVVMPMSVTAQGAEIVFKTIELNQPIDENVFKPEIPQADQKDAKPGSANDPAPKNDKQEPKK